MAKKLGLPVYGLNDLARSYGLAVGGDDDMSVDTDELRARVSGGIRLPSVVYGHLLPHALEARSAASVVVLRCEPSALKRRLTKRGYPPPKLLDNLEAELIGLVSSEAFAAFGAKKTSEVDTTHSAPSEAAEAVLEAFKGAPRRARVDWTLSYDSGPKLKALLSPP